MAANHIPRQNEGDKATSLLRQKRKEMLELLSKGVFISSNRYHYHFNKWRSETEYILIRTFGEDSIEFQKFKDAASLLSLKGTEAQLTEHRKKGMLRAAAELEAIVSSIEEYGIRKTQEAVISPPQLPRDTAQMANLLFDKMQFHPRVVEASKSLFETGHYAQAIFEAFKAVNNFVKQKTELSLDGKDLMAKVFKEEAPIIKLNELKTRSERDEQEGFKFLFMGAMVGIRNPKAHDNVIQTDPCRTLEYLGFASLLMRKVEEGEITRHPKE